MINREFNYNYKKKEAETFAQVDSFPNIRSVKYFMASFILACIMLLLTGCGDLVEIQNRDLVLAMGVSYKDSKYNVSFALPNLTVLTGQTAPEEEKFLVTYDGYSLPEIEEFYNLNSDKRLDYRHLKVIILDKSITSNGEKLSKFLTFLNDTYEVSRNVLVFFYPGDINELMDLNGKISGNIGEYLDKLYNNNIQKRDVKPVTVGGLIDSSFNSRTILVPSLKIFEGSVMIDGAAIIHTNLLIGHLTEEEYNLYHILQGKGKDYIFTLEDNSVIKLKEIESSMKYTDKNGTPIINVSLTGSAEVLYNNQENENMEVLFNNYLWLKISDTLDKYIAQNHIDYLNLYEKSSYKSKGIWLKYKNNPDDFMNNLKIYVDIRIKVQ